MRVLFFSSDVSSQSGASYALKETIRRVRSRGIDTVLVVPHSSMSHEVFGDTGWRVHFERIPRVRELKHVRANALFALSMGFVMFRLYRIIRAEQPAVIHCNEVTDLVAALVGRLCGIPVVVHVRADGLSRGYQRVLLSGLSMLASAVIVPSRSTERWIREHRSLRDRLYLVPDWAFDAEQFGVDTPRAPFRMELGVSDETIVVVLVSKLILMKGHNVFIRAAGRVSELRRDFRFVIVGGSVRGHEDEAEIILSAARPLVGAGVLNVLSPRQDLASVYAGADIAVHCPTYPDPFPTVVLLAMAMGTPIVASRIGGIPEQILHETDGILVDAGDADGLAEAILRLADDRTARTRLGQNSASRMRSEMKRATQGAVICDIYDAVMNSDRHSCPAH